MQNTILSTRDIDELVLNIADAVVTRFVQSGIEISSAVSSIEEKPLSVLEAANFLQLKEQTIRKLSRQRLLPCMKAPGQKRIYFLKSDLIKFLKDSRRKTVHEIREISPNTTPKRGRTMSAMQ